MSFQFEEPCSPGVTFPEFTQPERMLNLSAVPRVGTPISALDLDITIDCNLRCVYCFKEKQPRHMSDQTAFDAVVWLIHASVGARQLTITFMGGEPLLRFDLIKRLVPFAKRRAAYHRKKIHFSATTNNTLVTDEIVAFWKKWGMGFHCSIDGLPEIQNRNRPTVTGGPSSRLAEEGIRRIFTYQPHVCARCTVVPENVDFVVANFRYFRSMGFTNIAMVPGDPQAWEAVSNARFEEEFAKVVDLVMEDYRQGTFVRLKGLDEFTEVIAQNRPRRETACGAGRGMLLVDVEGGLWPCHRWNKRSHADWRIGSIYDGFSEEARERLDTRNHASVLVADCDICEAVAGCAGGCPAESLEVNQDVCAPPTAQCTHKRMFARLARRFHDTMKSEQNRVFMEHYFGKAGGENGKADE